MAATLDFTKFHNTINNAPNTTPQTRHAVNPSTEEPLPAVPVSTAHEVDLAMAAATAALPAWRALTWDQRAARLTQLADGLAAHHDAFRDLLAAETGKPAAGAAAMEAGMAAAHLRATAALRLPDEDPVESPPAPDGGAGASGVVRYRPLGVAVAIVPWNWPLALGVGKIGPGLLAGNTVVVKPSPFAPYALLKFVELAAAILPPGVLQVLSGDESLGPLLTAHPAVAKVSFTGSCATGQKVAEVCGRTLKRCTLELGGNDAAVVLDDVDVAKVVPQISSLAFIGSGQICMNIKRVYVHDKIYDAFLAAMVSFVRDNLKPGSATDANTFVGPVQNAMQYDKVKDLYEEADRQGWKVALGGLKEKQPADAKGYILPPTIIDSPAEDSRIVVEEPFGPILPVLRWSDEEDVIARANGTDAALGASVWGQDMDRATRIADRLEAGSVWVNTHFNLDPRVPFGGHKSSGMGMEWGTVGLKAWCNAQAFWTKQP